VANNVGGVVIGGAIGVGGVTGVPTATTGGATGAGVLKLVQGLL
jgi:hypothetical protein